MTSPGRDDFIAIFWVVRRDARTIIGSILTFSAIRLWPISMTKPPFEREIRSMDMMSPVPHFGAVLDWEVFTALRARLKAAGVDWAIEPYLRFEGQPGEQMTMFILDPSGNALEFKAFRDRGQLFAKD